MEKQSRVRIELDKIQSKIIDEFADIVSQEIDLSKTIIKGFYWKAIREWQKIHKKTLSETEQGQGSSFEERKLQANQISDIFRKKVLESTRTDHKSLEVGIKKALNNYMINYAKR
jgi:hypothetical protein